MTEETRARGKRMFGEVYGGVMPTPEDDASDEFISLMLDNLFSEIWSRPTMSIRDRRLVIIGIAAAMGEEFIFETQSRTALHKKELSEAEIREILILLTQYIGYPRASRLRARVQPLLSPP
jgi:4-carboxymuconolactone decarboxylase